MSISHTLDFSSLLSPKTIDVCLPGETKEEVLNNLIDLLQDHPAVLDLEVLREAVFKRENTMSTGVGKGIGLPHAKTAVVSDSIAAIAITRNPIPFGAIDDKDVRLLFLLVGTENAKSQHIKILSRISRIMNNDALRLELLRAENAQQVLDTIDKGVKTLLSD